MLTNTVTPETGRKLAAAGFPQPAPAPGQWWDCNGSLIYIWKENESGKSKYFTVTHYENGYPFPDQFFDQRDLDGLVYLPTVEDILAQPIAEGYGVSRQYDTTESGLSWVCCPTEWDAPEMVSAYHETSAAECAAMTWIKLKQKK